MDLRSSLSLLMVCWGCRKVLLQRSRFALCVTKVPPSMTGSMQIAPESHRLCCLGRQAVFCLQSGVTREIRFSKREGC